MGYREEKGIQVSFIRILPALYSNAAQYSNGRDIIAIASRPHARLEFIQPLPPVDLFESNATPPILDESFEREEQLKQHA